MDSHTNQQNSSDRIFKSCMNPKEIKEFIRPSIKTSFKTAYSDHRSLNLNDLAL
jgi:hypothetical protein